LVASKGGAKMASQAEKTGFESADPTPAPIPAPKPAGAQLSMAEQL